MQNLNKQAASLSAAARHTEIAKLLAAAIVKCRQLKTGEQHARKD